MERSQKFQNDLQNLQNALATAILSRIEINGRARIVEPTYAIRSPKYSVRKNPLSPSLMSISNGGILKSGNPEAT